jgi:DNA-directed RNA polymerase subunit RPC12/RpoP
MTLFNLQNQNLILFIAITLSLFLLAFPFRNWLHVRGENKKMLHWEKWVLEKPTKEEFCSRSAENTDVIQCNFCSTSRVFPGPEVGVVERLSYGFFQNSSQGFIHYKTYICSGCGSHLYREKI